MTIPAGTRLGPYEILAPLGAGGMGEVYRARDERLKREVAIKVLPTSFSQDAERLRRFEQEAQSAGGLNHPNITAVFDLGTHEGAPYIVSELLEGETLRARLSGGALAVRKATDYAIQMSHGLAAAHEKGIVHRDLKPENLFLTSDGRVKILDFGLAKLTQPEGVASGQTNLPTVTGQTEPGVVLGTLGYMAPEQVKGKSADARSDIFALGAILYEMLSGQRAFHRDSAAETMSAILREDPPDLSATNRNIPPGLDRVVRHCLEKNPEERFHSAHDLAFDLEALSGTSGQVSVGFSAAPRRTRRIPAAAFVAVGGIAGFAIALLALRSTRRATASSDAIPVFRRLTNLSGAEDSPSLSPDGQMLAFVHRSGKKDDIWVQRAGGRNPTDLTPDCQGSSASPAFSPDGSLIAYSSQCGEGGLFVMGATGESSRRLSSFGSDPAWSPDGREIVFSTELVASPYGRITSLSELWAVEVGSGKARKIFAGDAIQPSVSPHGLRIAFWALPEAGSQRDIWTLPYRGLKPGEKPVPVTQDAPVDWNPVWSPDGKALYFLSNRSGAMNLWKISIDEATGRTLGPAEPAMLPAREVGGMTISRDGRHIAYVDREVTHAIERLTVNPLTARMVIPPETILETSQEMSDFDVSPDGKTIAFDSRGGAQDDLYLVRSDGGGLRQLMDDPPKDRHPSFSPDGRRLAFHSDRSGRYEIWTIAIDGSGLTPLTQTTGPATIIEPLWSRDGRRVALNTGRDAMILTLDGKGAVASTETLPIPAPESFANPLAWSRDGRLATSIIRRQDLQATGLATYSPETKTFDSRIPFARPTRVRRGAFLGDLLLFTDLDGIWVANASDGTVRPILGQPLGKTYQGVACAREVNACYAVLASDNADIWQRTASETNGR